MKVSIEQARIIVANALARRAVDIATSYGQDIERIIAALLRSDPSVNGMDREGLSDAIDELSDYIDQEVTIGD